MNKIQNTIKPKWWSMIIVSAFVLTLFLPNIGAFLYLNYKIQAVRKEMKTKLKLGAPKELLQTMVFSKNEFENLIWTKPNKEFKKCDKMYDVVRKCVANNQITVICISDTNEDILFVKLDELVKKEVKKQGIHTDFSQFEIANARFDFFEIPQNQNYAENLKSIFHYKHIYSTKASFLDIKPPSQT